jgi:predicted enzyme related to lactoylglutathione lyase
MKDSKAWAWYLKKEPAKTQWGTLAMFEDTCGNFIQIHQA